MAATRKLDQSELMIRAGAEGESAVQRTQESRTRNKQQTLARKESARQFNKSIEQQELDRWQRQWEVQRADRAERDAVRAQNQAGKKDMTIFGQQGRAQRDAEAAYKRESVSDREKFDETKRQFDESQGLDAAKAGLRAKPEGGQANPSFEDRHAGAATQAPRDVVQTPTTGEGQDQYITEGAGPDQTGAQASLDPRQQQLQQEMYGREQEQMGRPIELGSQGSQWIADPTTPAGQDRALKRQSAEMALIKERRNLGFKMQEAQAKLDAANTKENKEFLKASEIKAQARIANFSDRYTKFDNAQGLEGDQPTESDWEAIGKLAGKVPPEGSAAGIHEAISSKQVTPRLMEFLGEKRAKMAIEYVANGTGELPDREYVDFLTEGMKQFMDEVQAARLKTKFDFGGPVGLLSATTRARQRRIVQKMAAMAILGGNTMAAGPAGNAAGAPEEAGADPAAAGGGATQVAGNMPPAAPPGMKRQQLAGRQHVPNQMGEQQANLGEPRKWSEVK